MASAGLPEVDRRQGAEEATFKSYPIGYFHIDIAEVQTAEGKLYLYVAIDRTTKFAFVQLVRKTGRTIGLRLPGGPDRGGAVQDPYRADRQRPKSGRKWGRRSKISLRQHASPRDARQVRDRTRRLPPAKEKVSSIANTGSIA